MGHARRITLLLVVLARTAAAGTCGDDDASTGVRLVPQGGRLIVDSVVADGAAATAGLQRDDVVVQANAVVVFGCSDWTKAVKDARRDRKALLVLVSRGPAHVPVVVPAATWGVVPPAVADASPPSKPSFPAPPPPPPPLPDDVTVSYDTIRRDLDLLAPDDAPRGTLTEYRKAVSQLRRAIATLSLRKAAPQERINALRMALRPFEAAEVAWDAFEGDRERERRSRRLPVAEEATAPFFSASPAAAAIDEFPFLRATVTKDPDGEVMESAGRWRAVQARALLWQHGRELVRALPSAP